MLLRYLPADCAIRRVLGVNTWTPEMVLLGDLFLALTGEVHPNAPKRPKRDASELNRLLLARRRRRERQLEALHT